MEPVQFALIVLLGFLLQFVDSSVGMGYGTLTPLLLLLGYPPLSVVPAVLATSAVLSLLTGGLYQAFRNIDFGAERTRDVLAVLLGFGVLGMAGGVYLAEHLPARLLTLYIGAVTVAVGAVILRFRRHPPAFSWPRMVGFGAVAAFNKGMTGGGFGPVLAGGQILSGVKAREAVGTTALVEGVLSAVGVGLYLYLGRDLALDLALVGPLLLGGFVASPIAAYVVKRSPPARLRLAVALASIAVGLLLLARTAL